MKLLIWLGAFWLGTAAAVDAPPNGDLIPPLPTAPAAAAPATPVVDPSATAETVADGPSTATDPNAAPFTPSPTAELSPEELAAQEAAAAKAKRAAELAALRSTLSGDALVLFDGLHAEKLAPVCGVTPRHQALLQALYEKSGYQRRWTSAALRQQLVDAIQASVDEGMKPARYHLAAISGELRCDAIAQDLLLSDALTRYAYERTHGQLNPRQFYRDWSPEPKRVDLAQILHDGLEKAQLAAALRQTAPQFALYWSLRDEYIRLRRGEDDSSGPMIQAGPILKRGSQGERVLQLRQRLKATGDLSPINESAEAPAVQQVEAGAGGLIAVAQAATPTTADNPLFDEVLEAAVKRFQARHRIAADGVVGNQTLQLLNKRTKVNLELIALNLERMRWLPYDLGARHIFVNIPSYEMQVVEDDKVVLASKVIVGKTGAEKTPTFSSKMNYLVLNPAWYVPPSIKRKMSPASAQRRGISVRGSTFRQPPGPNNPLGRVKFMFPNPHSVYLHDTPTKGLFNHAERHLSAGCVRVAKPYELAEYLLGRQGWSRDKIVKVSTAGRSERRVNLDEHLPVHLVYLTLWMDHDGVLQSRRDIYGHDKKQLDALKNL